MSQPYVGEIRIFGGSFAPAGWAFCDGQLMDIAENDTLFELIGTTYGGDGQSTFALPNLCSRIAFGDGGTMAFSESGGTESVTLTAQQIPIHSHAPVASNQATATTPAGNLWGTWGDGQYTSTVPSTGMDAAAIGNEGGNQPHENMPPFLATSYIISLFGIFPSQT
jgi:microcystin-dependent protein